jgi:two-component system chemotaxis family response regulator WspR
MLRGLGLLVAAASLLAYLRSSQKARRALDQKVRELLATERQLKEANAALAEANAALERLSAMDSLTGLANRRRLDEALETFYAAAARGGDSLGAAMVDIDHFKAYNDLYGHLAGDQCLRQVAATIKASLERPADLAARYGGEEFLVVLPDTGASGAAHVAERLRSAVEALGIPHGGSRVAGYVTVSVGHASIVPSPGGSATDLVHAADRALYAAKGRGRNRISD